MSDSDERPNQDETSQDETNPMADAAADLAEIARRARESGQALLTGSASVTFGISIEDALTPEEAVDKTMSYIARHGMLTMLFNVLDRETGEEYFVRAGRILTEDEARALARPEEDEGGEG